MKRTKKSKTMVRTKQPKLTLEHKICRKCGYKNPSDASVCEKCKNNKFQPTWIKEHKKINRAVSVDITESNPTSGEKSKRITLNKFFPGMKSQNFNITSPEHWERIKEIIDKEFAPILGWKEKEQLIEIVGQEINQKVDEPQKKIKKSKGLSNLIDQYPQLTAEFLDKISQILKNSDFDKVQQLLEHISNATLSYDKVFFESLKSLFETLKKEKTVSLVSFEELLREWSLKQITDVTKEVKRRLSELDLFTEKIQDEKTYEIRGDNSIHRILERSMWLIDEKYWIIQSNKQLRTFIGDELAKEDKKYQKNRPDFACGSLENTTVIIEIKRPSHELTVDDLQQVIKYCRLSKKYLGKKTTFKAMLIGNSKTTELEETMEFTQKIELLTYNDLVQDCKKRYSEFIKHVAKNKSVS